MNAIRYSLPLWLLICLTARVTVSYGQAREDAVVQSSTAVLNEIMSVPLKGIPASMLADAQGVAIIPSVIKGGFIVGARRGKGVLLVRDADQNWHAPVFLTLTGGNIGWQAGVQSTDVILVFKTQQSVQGLMSRKFTLGGDAAAAVGPVGRQAAAATDGRLKAEIYTYSRSRGLFLGVSIDGSVLDIDHIANATFYPSQGSGQPILVPQSALQLVEHVTKYCGGGQPPKSAVVQQPVLAREHSLSEVEAVRRQLAQIAPELYELLDPNWRAYLALPQEVFTGKGHPSVDELDRCLQRFKVVAGDPKFRTLVERPEFSSTHGLLRHYATARSQDPAGLKLPPPPTTTDLSELAPRKTEPSNTIR